MYLILCKSCFYCACHFLLRGNFSMRLYLKRKRFQIVPLKSTDTYLYLSFCISHHSGFTFDTFVYAKM
ncbi:hypothetical protein KUCAC02_017444 [Chaenocephalus aceratus]|uniref:Uncharacterized protein n=1 Tax=Chaenocephalus aceratus TaxID=36190 RepID=A0ACB9W1T0_CHAAC|nr:hypothetical protein KUCAC02_017444 [Chaenocephalus aceratus]